MSSFKSFKIWLGWFAERHCFLSAIFCIIGFVAALMSFFSIAGFMRPTLPSLNPVVGIVIIIVGSILSILAFTGMSNATSDNWRVAIMRARKFAEKNNLTENGYLLWLIEATERAKIPVGLNEWIEKYTEQEKITEDLQKLKEEQEQIPQKIKEKEERKQVLTDELFKRPFFEQRYKEFKN